MSLIWEQVLSRNNCAQMRSNQIVKICIFDILSVIVRPISPPACMIWLGQFSVIRVLNSFLLAVQETIHLFKRVSPITLWGLTAPLSLAGILHTSKTKMGITAASGSLIVSGFAVWAQDHIVCDRGKQIAWLPLLCPFLYHVGVYSPHCRRYATR